METGSSLKLIGVELYSDDLKRSRAFYSDVLHLPLVDEDPARFARFAPAGAFLCVETKGAEAYPSQDKAVVFLETPDLSGAVEHIGPETFAHIDKDASPPWAVLHDPDGHNVLIVQAEVDV